MKNTRDEIQTAALKALEGLNRAGVGITMGGGKTLIGLKHMNQHYTEDARFLVCAPKRSIFSEWESQSETHSLAFLLPHMNFTTYLSLSKQDLDYDVIYLDECHSLLDSHDKYLSQFKGKIIGLSGTIPTQQQSEKGMMVNEYCPIVYTYSTDEAISDSILNDYELRIHYLKLDENKNLIVEGNGKSFPTSEKASYEYWSTRIQNATGAQELQITRIMRMKAMMTFPSKRAVAIKLLNTITDKTILFANTQEQSDSFGIPSYHSKNRSSKDNLEAFKQSIGNSTSIK